MRKIDGAKPLRRFARRGSLVVLGIATTEVLIMTSPFAGLFYATVSFGGFFAWLSQSPATAWLNGFFLNHSVVTTSVLLEMQREVGLWLFVLGTGGFLYAAAQVYSGKVGRRGVATRGLYRLVRHPQYFCLGVAGWGLLTTWPRFLLLGIWVTTLFLYAGLARFEERRMGERFGEEYQKFTATRGSFLPGSPMHRLFEATFGKLSPRPLAWGLAYVASLTLAFSLGFALRTVTRESTAMVVRPEHETVVISVWPQPDQWMERVVAIALQADEVENRLQGSWGAKPLVATILPPRYPMRGMYFKMASTGDRPDHRCAGVDFPFLYRKLTMGRDPAATDAPVEVVFSRAHKPFKSELPFEEVLDAGVLLTPLVVVELLPDSSTVLKVHDPLPQNEWGPRVVMPIF